MTDRNTSKIGSIALVLAVLVSAVGIGLSGGVAAQTGSTVLIDQSFTPSNTTDSAYVDIKGVDDFSGSAPVDVNVTYTGYNDGMDVANGTVLKTETVSVSEGNISSSNYSVTDSVRSEWDNVQVLVDTDSGSLVDYADWGTLEMSAGGGGGLLGGAGGLSLPVIGVVLVGAYILMGRD
ncbi:hypothetical protein HRPV12-gp03 [Halorubrum pleomorphic virus 12]|uniref:Uncharacterized protein n=1 Tax=Halorubrum pleomorphic virus 12 TaxID=2507578 RepID=A0A410N6M6_9VIRU|nr:hypothetical protein HOV13_gp03 [Halorubrum pleomorphic virus 12]QAS68807.1 hypothetical protein HRPV12-gp03 [Halorubrum pleomorphic virus 12]